MAEDNEDRETNDTKAEESSGNSKKKLIILVVAGLVAIVALIGGTLYLLGFFAGGDADDEETDVDVVEEVVVAKLKPAMYFPIKPAFIVNFQSRGRQRFLQVEITVMTRDVEVFNALQTHAPLIKNRMVMLLGGEVYEELQTDEGKELLRQKALEALQNIMQQEIGKPGIEQVLFTNFVMQ
ncbi:MAG: flagellar basal body-associated FliL family protein [Pseudomonadales bacterium]